MVIDSNVGLTKLDLEMLQVIDANKHHIVIIENKIDKLGKEERAGKISSIVKEAQNIPVLEYSAKTEEGKEALFKKIGSFLIR